VAKDKKKKKDKAARGDGVSKATDTLKTLAQSPLVAEVVAAALVATAAALKDSNRARALASDAADEIAKLSKNRTRQGDVLWDMAMQIGRRSLDAMLSGNGESAKPKSAKPKSAKAKPAGAKSAKAKPAAKKSGGKKASGDARS
jgi:hypothetical protein